jgi:hypothetical protein
VPKLNHSHGPVPSQVLARYPAARPVAAGRPRNQPTERGRVQPKPTSPAHAVPRAGGTRPGTPLFVSGQSVSPGQTRVFVRVTSGLPKAFKVGVPQEELEKLTPRRSALRLPPGVSSSLYRRGGHSAFFLSL